MVDADPPDSCLSRPVPGHNRARERKEAVRAVLKRLNLRRVGPAERLEIEFVERLNVFTGDNGLGKSFVLDIAWWILTRTWAGRPAQADAR